MVDLQHTLDLIEDDALDEAVATLRHLLAQMPAYTPAYVLLAQAYEAQARWPEALRTWQKAYFLAPNSPVIREGLLQAAAEHPLSETPPETPRPSEMDLLADDLLDTIRMPGPPPSSAAPEPIAEDDKTPAAPEETEAAPADEEAATPPPASPAAPADEAPDEETAADKETQAETTSPAPDTAPDPAEATADRVEDEAAPPEEKTPPPTGRSPEELIQERLEELARQTPTPGTDLPKDIQDLDRLIEELEGARIDPQPALDEAPPPDLDDDIEDMVSETLARIYIAQHQYAEAARVYQRLAVQDPEHADAYRAKAAELQERARDDAASGDAS